MFYYILFCIATTITAVFRISKPAITRAEEYIDMDRVDKIAQYFGHVAIYMLVAPLIFVSLIANSRRYIDILSQEIIQQFHG